MKDLTNWAYSITRFTVSMRKFVAYFKWNILSIYRNLGPHKRVGPIRWNCYRSQNVFCSEFNKKQVGSGGFGRCPAGKWSQGNVDASTSCAPWVEFSVQRFRPMNKHCITRFVIYAKVILCTTRCFYSHHGETLSVIANPSEWLLQMCGMQFSSP